MISTRRMEFAKPSVSFSEQADVKFAEPDVERVVLVTGAAGFIGSHVADRLMMRGDRVIIVGLFWQPPMWNDGLILFMQMK